MSAVILANDNFYSKAQYPEHVITAEEEPAGFEAFRVGRASRSSLNYATATTANSPWYLRVVCDRVRGANYWALDRTHNLAGKTMSKYASQDNFTTNETIVSYAIPSASGSGRWDDGLGVRTEEGVHLQRFPLRTAKYWEDNVSAMGSGLKPQIGGLWLGLAVELERLPELPFSEDAHDLVQQMEESDTGWMGGTQAVPRRSGSITLRFGSTAEYEAARRTLLLFGQGVPTWLTIDSDQPERTILVVRAPGSPFGMPYTAEWWNLRKTTLSYVEWEPKVP